MSMFVDFELCHLKMKIIHSVLGGAQFSQLQLQRYKRIPDLYDGAYCFNLDVNEDTPLFEKFGVWAVSISYPPDCKTLEILLRSREGREADAPFDDVWRFNSIGELMVFLDTMVAANDVGYLESTR